MDELTYCFLFCLEDWVYALPYKLHGWNGLCFFFVFCFLDLIILIVVHDDVEVTYYTGFHVDLQILYISF